MSIRLAIDYESDPLDFDAAKATARSAYDSARKAQLDLVSNLSLTSLIWRGDTVNIRRLHIELAEARRQVERAMGVVDHLEHAIEVVETTEARRR